MQLRLEKVLFFTGHKEDGGHVRVYQCCWEHVLGWPRRNLLRSPLLGSSILGSLTRLNAIQELAELRGIGLAELGEYGTGVSPRFVTGSHYAHAGLPEMLGFGATSGSMRDAEHGGYNGGYGQRRLKPGKKQSKSKKQSKKKK